MLKHTDKQIVQMALDIYNKEGKLTSTNAGRTVYARIKSSFGSVVNFLDAHGLEKTPDQIKSQGHSREYVLSVVQSIYNEHGKVNGKLVKQDGRISVDAIKRRCGSMKECLLSLNIPLGNMQNRNKTKEDIMPDMIRIHEEFGYISKPLVEKHSIHNPKVIRRLYGSFENFYKETGFNRNPSGRKVTIEMLQSELKRLAYEYGYISKEIIEKAEYSWFSFLKHFGSIKAMCEYAEVDYLDCRSSNGSRQSIRFLTEILGEEPIQEYTNETLINEQTKCHIFIDAYFPKSNLAFEYHGSQHFRVDGFYTKDEEHLNHRKYLDSLKESKCEELGYQFLAFTYLDKITYSFVKEQLYNYNIIG